MQINGLNVLITGGGSGLGAATARKLTDLGARVAILDLPISKGQDVADSLEGGLFVDADVTSADKTAEAINTVCQELGSIQVAVNCAGIATGDRTVGRDNVPADLDQFTRTVTINLIGTYNVIRLAASKMASNEPNENGERGVVINTASVAAFEGQIGQAAYAASKGGVVGLTLTVARDLARYGIRNCTIAPGLFLTPMMEGLPEATRDALASVTPFPQRLGKPEEYADLASHIIENSMLNGEVIRLDGAVRLQPR